jgi:hypothetical protein
MTLLPRRDDFLPSVKSDRPANSKRLNCISSSPR